MTNNSMLNINIIWLKIYIVKIHADNEDLIKFLGICIINNDYTKGCALHNDPYTDTNSLAQLI